MENTIKVRAKARTKDIIESKAKAAKVGDMVSWWQRYRRGGVDFSTERWTTVTIVDPPNKPFGEEGETNERGAIDMLADLRLEVQDGERARDLMAKALEENRKEEMRHQKRIPFIHADIVDEYGNPVVDDQIEGQGVVFEDGFEDMTKTTLKDALLNAGFDETATAELFKAGKSAMIAALRGH